MRLGPDLASAVSVMSLKECAAVSSKREEACKRSNQLCAS